MIMSGLCPSDLCVKYDIKASSLEKLLCQTKAVFH